MKRTVYTSFLLLLLVSACSENNEKKIISVEKKIVYKEAVPVSVNREMKLDVAGMSCEHACGGSIRTALKSTNAVDRCAFDFQKDRKVNTAIITFDKNKISPDQIIGIIEDLNGHQFKTGKSSTRAIETETPVESSVAPSKSGEETETLDVSSTTSFEFPNLFELFSHIIS